MKSLVSFLVLVVSAPAFAGTGLEVFKMRRALSPVAKSGALERVETQKLDDAFRSLRSSGNTSLVLGKYEVSRAGDGFIVFNSESREFMFMRPSEIGIQKVRLNLPEGLAPSPQDGFNIGVVKQNGADKIMYVRVRQSKEGHTQTSTAFWNSDGSIDRLGHQTQGGAKSQFALVRENPSTVKVSMREGEKDAASTISVPEFSRITSVSSSREGKIDLEIELGGKEYTAHIEIGQPARIGTDDAALQVPRLQNRAAAVR